MNTQKQKVNKEDVLWLHFHIKQKFNLRQINKTDKFGKPISLVSLSFPFQSSYNGCYISVNAAFIKDDKFHFGELQQISVLSNAPIKVWRYDKNKMTEAELVTTLTGSEVVKEFDAWKQDYEKE